MVNCELFKGITEEEFEKISKCFNLKNILFKKGQSILYNIQNVGTIGIVVSGEAQLIRYDYNGGRTILVEYNTGEVFGDVFSNIADGEILVQATIDSEIIFMDYDHLINRCKKNCPFHNTMIENMIQILAKRIYEQNQRIEILTKRSIRDKLLKYFNIRTQKISSKIIYLPFNYTDLADYLSIDRSAMMRELKNLKDDGLIRTKGKIIYILY